MQTDVTNQCVDFAPNRPSENPRSKRGRCWLFLLSLLVILAPAALLNHGLLERAIERRAIHKIHLEELPGAEAKSNSSREHVQADTADRYEFPVVTRETLVP